MTDLDSATAAVLAKRCAAQLLSGPPAGSALAVVRAILAVQGQDQRGARLAIRARSSGLTATDVDRALTTDRTMLISWLNRGTLHLVAAEDYWWLHRLTTPPLISAIARRLAAEGGITADDTDLAVSVIDAALAADGPLTRAQLGQRIAAVGVRTQGQALVHLLAAATVRGVTVRGPVVGREQAFVRVRDWLGAPPAYFEADRFDRDVALAELARRYLAGHGPASDRDLAGWAGLPLRDARRGLTAIAGELCQRDDGLADLAADRGSGQGSPPAHLPPPRLLGSFDPLLHGWADRGPVLGPHRGIVTVNGLFRPFAIVRGRAVATWRLSGGRVALAPFGPLAESVRAALEVDAGDVTRFLGLPSRAR